VYETTQPPGRHRRDTVEEVAVDFTKRKFGAITSPYLLPYIYGMDFMYKQYAIKKVGDY
jgi:hypothetical protein